MSHDLTQKEPKTQIDDTDDTDDTPMEQEHDRGQEQQAQNEDMKDEEDKNRSEDIRSQNENETNLPEEVKTEGNRERSRSPPMRDEKSQAFQSYNTARQLDGMGPVSQDDPAFQRHWQSSQQMDEDEELMADTFREKKLSAEERKEFDLAKIKALQVWLDNSA